MDKALLLGGQKPNLYLPIPAVSVQTIEEILGLHPSSSPAFCFRNQSITAWISNRKYFPTLIRGMASGPAWRVRE